MPLATWAHRYCLRLTSRRCESNRLNNFSFLLNASGIDTQNKNKLKGFIPNILMVFPIPSLVAIKDWLWSPQGPTMAYLIGAEDGKYSRPLPWFAYTHGSLDCEVLWLECTDGLGGRSGSGVHSAQVLEGYVTWRIVSGLISLYHHHCVLSKVNIVNFTFSHQ